MFIDVNGNRRMELVKACQARCSCITVYVYLDNNAEIIPVRFFSLPGLIIHCNGHIGFLHKRQQLFTFKSHSW